MAKEIIFQGKIKACPRCYSEDYYLTSSLKFRCRDCENIFGDPVTLFKLLRKS